MLDRSTIWETARRCDEALRQRGLPYAIVGGVAVCLHGYQRTTIDLDILVSRADTQSVREALEAAGFQWHAAEREFRDQNDVPVQCVISAEPAGSDVSLGVFLPEPDAEGVAIEIEGLRVVALSRWIELKMACGLGSLRRAFRDLGDVVELIAVHDLGRDYARFLPKRLRKEFRELVLRARG